MTYPGNSTLAADLQARIQETFQQTLDLAEKGNRQEAALGCDFILRLDPMFEPARTLQQRLQGGSGTLEIADLRTGTAAPAAPAAAAPFEPAEELFSDLDDLNLELPELPPAAAAEQDLRTRLTALLSARDFQSLLELAEREKKAVSADPELRKLLDQARTCLEAEPYVRTFLESAREALQAGDSAEAERLLEKARALDSTHPGLQELEQARAFYADPERRMGSRRRGIEVEERAKAPAAPADFDFILPEELSPAKPEVEFAGAEAEAAETPTFGEPAGETTVESEPRIAELLREGQAALERGDPQAAIDAWSRIFLIDIDHEEAARRIEQARRLKAEREREVEEIFHGAVEKFEAGAYEEAKAGFDTVLEKQPGYYAAREYLDQLAGLLAGAPSAPAPAVVEPAAPGGAAAARPGRGELKEEILVPPEPGTSRPAPREEPAGVAMAARRHVGASFLAIGGGVLILVAAGGWFLYSNWDRFFPNAQPVQSPVATVVDPISRAKALHEEGKTAIALAQLRRLPPDDAHYGEAQALISQWEALEAPAAQEPTGPTTEEIARREALIEEGRRAYAGREYLLATSQFQKAAEIAALEPQISELLSDAQRQLQPLEKELNLYRQGDWEYALNSLWHLRDTQPGNRDVARLIIDSYYNLGVRDLQRGDPTSASEQFREALALSPNDATVKRLHAFAQTYEERGEDLLYRIYVKYLPFRRP